MEDKNTITPELLDSTERYYNDLMPLEEKEQFEAKLEQDALFKQQVLDIKTIILAIESQSLKEKLHEFHKNIPTQVQTKPLVVGNRFFNFRNIAAALLVLALSATFWIYSASSNEKLYDSYFQVDPGLPTTMSTSDDYDFYDGMVNYKRGEFKTAISKWSKIQTDSTNSYVVSYFLGVAHLANKEIDLAIPYLLTASKNEQGDFYDDANYYLGLAYLKKGNDAEAIHFLEKSSHQNSRKILEELK